jgi:MscS family membrane protein
MELPLNRTGRHAIIQSLLLCVVVFAVTHVAAQSANPKKSPPSPAQANPAQAPAPLPEAPTPPPPDPLGRESPRGCVLGFLRGAEAQDYGKAAKYLDSNKTEEQSEELVRQLKALLDLSASTGLNNLSREPEGDLNDNLRTSREKIAVVSTPNGPLDVLLERVERPSEQAIWLFSQETLRNVPAAYASVQHRDFGSNFPGWMSRITFLSFPLWRWVLVVASILGLLVLASLLMRMILWLLRSALRTRMTPATELAVLKLKGPTFGLMLAFIQHSFSGYSLTALGRARWDAGALLIALISGAWLLARLTDIISTYTSNRLNVRMQIERVTFVGLVARIFKIFIGAVLVIVLLSRAGVNVSALVTGLGIGGIALALAAQKTLSDLFGGIAIVMRGAVRVGDFCTIAGKQGTVEEIGISSIRIRTLDRTVVSIPNTKVAEMDLENFSMRDQFWVHQVFTLRFDTSYSVVQRVLRRMLQLLQDRPDVDITSARASVIQLTNQGPQVEIFAYYRKPGSDYTSFLAEQEQIIFGMMRIVEEEGTSMVAPVGVVQMSQEKFATAHRR